MIFKLRGIKSVLLCAAVLIFAGSSTATAVNMLGEATGTGGVLLGDANRDGAVDIRDVTCIQRILAEWQAAGSYSEAAADVDGNGRIDINDASTLQRHMADMETPYQIGEEIDEPPDTTAAETTQPTTQRQTDEDGWGRDIYRP